MVLAIEENRSRIVSYLAIFTALVTVFDAIPIIPGLYSGVWDSWIFLLSPIIGVLLGPLYALITMGFGSLLGHFVYYRDPFELFFMFGAVVGSVCSALIFQRRWKPVLFIYTFLLGGYFLTPVSWVLPLVGIWDILLGYSVLILFVFLINLRWWPSDSFKDIWLSLLFAAIIGLETDILFRVFLLVPGQTYWFFYGWTTEFLQNIWITAGIITPTKVALATLFTVTIGYSLLRLLPRAGIPFIETYGTIQNSNALVLEYCIPREPRRFKRVNS